MAVSIVQRKMNIKYSKVKESFRQGKNKGEIRYHIKINITEQLLCQNVECI